MAERTEVSGDKRTNQPTPTRRRCLTSAFSTAMLFCIGGWSSRTAAATAARASFAQANLLSLAPQRQAALVGAAVLPQLEHPTPQALMHSLVSRITGFLPSDLHEACDARQLHIAFQEAVRADFAQSRCVSVNGWVLARTEGEICALAALSANNS